MKVVPNLHTTLKVSYIYALLFWLKAVFMFIIVSDSDGLKAVG